MFPYLFFIVVSLPLVRGSIHCSQGIAESTFRYRVKRQRIKNYRNCIRSDCRTHEREFLHTCPDLKDLYDKGANEIYDIVEEAISNGVDVNGPDVNPFLCPTINSLESKIEEIQTRIANTTKKRKRSKENATNCLPHVSKKLRELPANEYHIAKHILQFEHAMFNTKLTHCPCCKSKSLNLECHSDLTLKQSSVCGNCRKITEFTFDRKLSDPYWLQLQKFMIKRSMLPVWFKKDDPEHLQPQFHIPPELASLTFVEELLIQRFSAYIPVFHMNKGHFGFHGHCVCFRQDLQAVCTILPRKRCSMIKVFRTSSESNDTTTKHFNVNRQRVLKALQWLKDHNHHYRDITIATEHLDWMGSRNECEINDSVVNVITRSDELHENCHIADFLDQTVSRTQTYAVSGSNDIEFQCVSNEVVKPVSNRADEDILEQLKESLMQKDIDPSTMNFPSISDEPINEWDDDVLPNIYPKLYPGGFGGSNNHMYKTDVKTYGKRLINYFDGRFSTDKTWAFYVNDMSQRNANNKNGNFIIKHGFLGNVYKTVEELKEAVQNDNYKWINLLRHFSQRVRGSDNYWRGKRKELEAWINYHVDRGHGPPTLFLTLSCAENWWPDLLRILKDVLKGTEHEHLIEEMESSDENVRNRARSKASSLHSMIVQEFFQIRVEEWMKHIGKKVFKIKHYWARFEFAKGRGQIHLHLLAIIDTLKYQMDYYYHTKRGEHEDAMKVLSEFATGHFGLTAEHPAGKSNKSEFLAAPEGTCQPSEYKKALNTRFCESDNQEVDRCQLCNSVQMHVCNKYCMRFNKQKKKWYCRAGCGFEQNEGEMDTEGWPISDKDNIFVDKARGLKLLRLKRTFSQRFNQTSMPLLSSWRANCDAQIIIYESDPRNPNLEEVRKVSNYVVSYVSKVNQSVSEEKHAIKELILNCDKETESSSNDMAALCKEILNKFTSQRVISRSEVMVEIASLPLVISSETIENINISGSTKVFQHDTYEKNIMHKYKTREQDLHHLSFLQFFYLEKDVQFKKYLKSNPKAIQKTIIPNPIGRVITPRFFKDANEEYVLDYEYAKSMLILHKPWKHNECQDFLNNNECALKTFYEFLNSTSCPNRLKDIFEAAIADKSTTFEREYVETNEIEENPADCETENGLSLLRNLPTSQAVFNGTTLDIDNSVDPNNFTCLVSKMTKKIQVRKIFLTCIFFEECINVIPIENIQVRKIFLTCIFFRNA